MKDKWLLWMWEYYSLNVYICDSLEACLQKAMDMSNAGVGATGYVERPDGTIEPENSDAYIETWERLYEQERAATAAADRKEPDVKYFVEISGIHEMKTKKLAWVRFERYTNKATALAHRNKLRKQLGDRVRVMRYTKTAYKKGTLVE